jgi:hypothetical protein
MTDDDVDIHGVEAESDLEKSRDARLRRRKDLDSRADEGSSIKHCIDT